MSADQQPSARTLREAWGTAWRCVTHLVWSQRSLRCRAGFASLGDVADSTMAVVETGHTNLGFGLIRLSGRWEPPRKIGLLRRRLSG